MHMYKLVSVLLVKHIPGLRDAFLALGTVLPSVIEKQDG